VSTVRVVYAVRVRAAVELMVGPFDTLEEAWSYAVGTRSAIVPIFEPQRTARELLELTPKQIQEALE